MRVIYKYPIEITSVQTLHIPETAKFLKAGFQDDQLCAWFELDTGESKIERQIAIIGTGHEIKETKPRKFLETVFQGPFVWHIFEVLK